MKRTGTALVALAICGLGLSAHDDPKSKANVKTLSRREIVEKLDGKKTSVTMLEVTLEPGRVGAPHRHPGPVFGYVLEGEYEWAIDDQPARTLKVGDTFYEPAGCLHRVSKNASTKDRARVLAVMLHPADAKHLVLPEPPAKKK
jgi:quercetin dioxygenase-like cupin family protein